MTEPHRLYCAFRFATPTLFAYRDVFDQRGRQQSESCSLIQMTDRELWAVYGDREGLAASAVSVCRDAGTGNANESAILRSDDLEACRLGYPDVSCAPACAPGESNAKLLTWTRPVLIKSTYY